MEFTNILEKLKFSGVGDHMVLLYDNNDYNYNADVIAAYIASRILNNERCFYITGDADTGLILDKLTLLIDLEKSINTGQLAILDKNEAYSKDGTFNPDNMISLLKELSIEAIDQGYNAFAITGEISWVLKYDDGFDKIMEYEYKLNNEIFGKYPVSAICRYNINKFSSEMIKNIIEVHPIIIWKGTIHENPFYFEVVDTENIDINEYQVQEMLKTITNFTNTKSKFENELHEQEKRNQLLQLNLMKNIIVSLTSLLEIHDKYTKNHSENVAKIAMEIAMHMGLPQEEVSQIYYAGLVHDIGKAIIPSEIINKKEKLTHEEFNLIKLHPYYGYKALASTKELQHISNLVLQHHERIDGNGYPLQIGGNDILTGSKILCIADSYDAMINDRPYHKGLTKREAIDELYRCSNRQFDEKIVDIFINEIIKNI